MSAGAWATLATPPHIAYWYDFLNISKLHANSAHDVISSRPLSLHAVTEFLNIRLYTEHALKEKRKTVINTA
jgi:hypothetical protein